MDANKAEMLRKIEYKISPACATCIHGQFKGSVWGTCATWQYDHLKHSESTRQLSVHVLGHCFAYKPDPKKLADLGKFQEFIKE